MNPNKFVQLSQRTSAEVTNEVKQRLLNEYCDLEDSLNAIASDAHELDRLKKHIFYGKLTSLHADSKIDVIGQGKFKEPKMVKLLHGIVGIATEFGELWDIVARYLEGKDSKLNKEHCKEEVGDILWYITEVVAALDVDLIDLMEENINKLKKRYPEKFTEEDAVERKDKVCSWCNGTGQTVINEEQNTIACTNCNGTGVLP